MACSHSETFSGQGRPAYISLGANNSLTVHCRERKIVLTIDVNFQERSILFLVFCVLEITRFLQNNQQRTQEDKKFYHFWQACKQGSEFKEQKFKYHVENK